MEIAYTKVRRNCELLNGTIALLISLYGRAADLLDLPRCFVSDSARNPVVESFEKVVLRYFE